MRALVAIGLCISLVPMTGCGIGLQTAFGWRSHASEQKTEAKPVSVTSVPSGALVTRRDPDGKETLLGNTPLTDAHTLTVQQEVNRPSTIWLWIGFGVEMAASVAALASRKTSSSVDSGGSGGETLDRTSNGSEALTIAAGTFALAGVVDLIVVLVHGAGAEEITNRNVEGGTGPFVYTARSSGLPDAQGSVKIPEQSALQLVLDPNAPATNASQVASEKPKLKSGSGEPVHAEASWVVAVMNVEDANAGDVGRAIDLSLIRNLGDQIRVFVAQQGVRTVDRGAQERYLKEQIADMKKESYKSCYDDNCQIELGKALAASHVLRTRITRFGKRCVLNGELIDLRAEVTMAAASSQGTCEAEGFLNMGEEVARNLVRK